MAEALLDALGGVLTRWTMGGSAGSTAPVGWRDALGDDPREAELRLLALAGQFLGSVTLVDPTGEVRAPADLPRLASPPLADALRPRARRLLQQMREAERRRDLLDFLDRRGWTLHPGDWLPGPNEDVPAVYAPWQDWAVAAEATATADDLSADSWDMLPPAARRAAFAELRRRDPARAAALLAEKIGGEPADVRVRLLETLATGLSDADRTVLDALAGDRAPRVKALAASLLARLGHGADSAEDVAELAAFFTVQTKGLLRRTRVIVPQPLKTPAQRNRRDALMETVTFPAFARALGLAPEELIAAWPLERERDADRALASMVGHSAPDTIVAALVDALLTPQWIDHQRFYPFLRRLTVAQRRAAAMAVLRTPGGTFEQALTLVRGDGGLDEPMASAAGTALLHALKRRDAGPSDGAGELTALGLIASQAAARAALDELAAAGLIASDPRLDMLRLNAALDHRGHSE